MIFHLLRTWLRPLVGKALRSSGRAQYKSSSGVQTIGGGGGGGDRYPRRHAENPVRSNITFGNSEERIIDEVKMQELKAFEPDTSSIGGGILVSNRIDVVQENSSIGSQGVEGHAQHTRDSF